MWILSWSRPFRVRSFRRQDVMEVRLASVSGGQVYVRRGVIRCSVGVMWSHYWRLCLPLIVAVLLNSDGEGMPFLDTVKLRHTLRFAILSALDWFRAPPQPIPDWKNSTVRGNFSVENTARSKSPIFHLWQTSGTVSQIAFVSFEVRMALGVRVVGVWMRHAVSRHTPKDRSLHTPTNFHTIDQQRLKMN